MATYGFYLPKWIPVWGNVNGTYFMQRGSFNPNSATSGDTPVPVLPREIQMGGMMTGPEMIDIKDTKSKPI